MGANVSCSKPLQSLFMGPYVLTMSLPGNHDLVILGAGPAGLSLAAAACARGARVAIVAPDPHRTWVPNWSAFEDEVPGVPVQRRWARTEVHVPGRHLVRDRAYVQVDGPALQADLTARAADATWCDARVSHRQADGVATDVGTVRGRHVVDCTGAAQVLGRRGPKATAWQTAYGVHIETDGHPWDPEVATYMDLRGLTDRPSFLYAMPTSPTGVFVEETSLAARPAVPLDELQRRLDRRLADLGIQVRSRGQVERCVIPMDVPPPAGLAFGTAAGMTHPATGYLLARTLAAAPAFVDALLDAGPDRAMASVRSASRRLHLLGLDVLTLCDGDELMAFFDAFFAQPPWVVDAFLARDPTLPATVAAMLRIFATSPNRVRRLLVRPLYTAQPLETACTVR
jgi:lycopene beta-cyclase